MVTHSPPTSEVGSQTPDLMWERWWCLIDGQQFRGMRTLTNCMYWFPQPIKLSYDLYSVESDIKTQIDLNSKVKVGGLCPVQQPG